ncbi:hypothetical protein I656_01912 [Geobacillus sp. WSUCF1]|nr:hypothetical protein I656_01912 [Geobacillus sp. WSUCF1]
MLVWMKERPRCEKNVRKYIAKITNILYIEYRERFHGYFFRRKMNDDSFNGVRGNRNGKTHSARRGAWVRRHGFGHCRPFGERRHSDAAVGYRAAGIDERGRSKRLDARA